MGENKNTAILVINLLVDMVERGRPFPMPPEYKAILQRTVSFIQAAHQAGYPVIFVQDQHRPDDPEFSDFRAGQPHAIRGTEGSQLIPELFPLTSSGYTVGKRRFSAFFGTDLDLYLREEGIRRLVLVGRPSNVCVLYSAADAFFRSYEVIAIADCLYSRTGMMHERAMREFAETLGTVLTSEEFLAGGPGPLPERTEHLALLVVNVNRDLVENDLPEDGRRVAARLDAMQALLSLFREMGLPVLYTMDAHAWDDPEFRWRKPHGIQGTPGAEIVPPLSPQGGETVFAKRYYDAFYETGLDPWLRKHGITRLVIMGAPTHVDVRYTVVSAYNYRYRPIVIKDCTDACTAEYAEEALQDLFFCWRTTLEQFQEWLRGEKDGR